jgi:hypothetical protein
VTIWVFFLEGGPEEFENEWTDGIESIGCYTIAYVNEKGEVVYLDAEAPFGPDCILEMAEWVKQNPPPGKYTVPELGLKDASFYEVLMACYRKVKEAFENPKG